MRLLPALALCLLPGLALAEGRSIIVLDASGSMWGQIDGRAKLEIAREALGTVLSGIPAETEIGLIAYGHRTKGDCADIELVVPPAAGTGPAITAAANDMKFLGKTPLTESVRQAAAALRSTEAKATVILITDGIETCNADPCALGAELEASGVDFTAHVVGFGLTKEEGQAVACLAENTGGKYIEAADAGSLTEALKTTVAVAEPPPPPPAPAVEKPALVEYNLMPTATFAAEGDPVPADLGMSWQVYLINADGTTGESVDVDYGDARFTLPAGTYRVIGTLEESTAALDIAVVADQTATPVLNLNAGRLVVSPRIDAAAPVTDGAAVRFTLPDGRDTTYYGLSDVFLPAGDFPITVTIDNATVSQVVAIAAGSTQEIDMIAAAGIAAVEAFYAPGVMVEGNAHSVVVYPARKKLDGSRERIETKYGMGNQFTLPPGDYVAEVGLDGALAELPFTIKANERTDVAVVLNAGVAAILAEGASMIEILPAKARLDGSRDRISYDYDGDFTFTLPAGDYVAVVTRADTALPEVPFSVVAAERTELTVP